MRSTRALVVLSAASVAASIAFAGDQTVGKKTLGGRGFATTVTVAFTAPQGYTIAGGGYENWRGPDFSSIATGSDDLESGVHFDVHPDEKARTAEKAARNKLGTDMGGLPTRQVAAGPLAVPHIVRGKKVGVIKGFYVIMQVTKKTYEGWYEGGLGFTLGRGYPALAADVDTTAPADDADKRIEGQLPSVWNRRVVDEGIRGIFVEGNFAPRNLTVRVQGRRLTGQARDALGHAVVSATVKLRQGSKTCCRTKTSATGAFALSVPTSAGTGMFRLTVAAGGATLTKTVRLG
jgi:hypothetical protein